MEDEEGAEYGKADFVLLDQVTMEDFMENLKLRWAPRPAPCSLGTGKEGEERHSSHPGPVWAWVTAGGHGSQARLTP